MRARAEGRAIHFARENYNNNAPRPLPTPALLLSHYFCSNIAIDITTKVKGVRIDSCANVTILLQGALSGIEVVNSKRMKMQVKDRVPSVAIDKTDGCLVGLPFSSRDTLITTSKSSEMNVTFPESDKEDAEWVEAPIPEQFVSKILDSGKVHTHVSELYTS